MAKFFGDIGKACKDLLGGFNFDHKVSVSSKTSTGVTLTGTGAKKGDAVSGDVKGSYTVCKGCTVDATVNDAGKISTSVAMSDVAPGLKATVSGTVPDVSSGKLALQFAKEALGLKADLGLSGAPKVDLSSCVKMGSVACGAEMSYDSSKGTVTKYGAAATYLAPDFTLAAVAADKMDTVKVSYVQSVSPTLTVGAEIVRKMKASSTTFTLGASTKLDGGASAKGTLDSKGVVSLLYSTPLQPKTTITFCTQFDTRALDKSAKVGIQLGVKG